MSYPPLRLSFRLIFLRYSIILFYGISSNTHVLLPSLSKTNPLLQVPSTSVSSLQTRPEYHLLFDQNTTSFSQSLSFTVNVSGFPHLHTLYKFLIGHQATPVSQFTCPVPSALPTHDSSFSTLDFPSTPDLTHRTASVTVPES